MSVTLRETRKGVWRLRVETKGPEGQRIHRYQKFQGTKAEAEVERARLLLSVQAETRAADVVAAPPPGAGAVTIAEYAERWLAHREAIGALAPNTLDMYRAITTHVVSTWGKIGLRALTRNDVIVGLGKLSQRGLSPRTVRHVYTRLGAVLKEAIAERILTHNVTVGVPLPKAKRTAGRIMHDDELALLLQRVRSHRLGPEVRFILGTGARRGELCALLLRDFDLETGTVRIERSVAQRGKRRETWVKGPKSEAGRRTVKLPATLLAELRALFAERAKQYAEAGVPPAQQYAFINRLGEPWKPGTITEAIIRMFNAIGLDGYSAHDLRHIHASALLKRKNNPKAVAGRLGHSDATVTMSIYAHVLPQDDGDLAESIEEVMK
ncbi:integrase [Microcystis phage MJing1]|nr:integrase [Microcystis phage MJing1]